MWQGSTDLSVSLYVTWRRRVTHVCRKDMAGGHKINFGSRAAFFQMDV